MREAVRVGLAELARVEAVDPAVHEEGVGGADEGGGGREGVGIHCGGSESGSHSGVKNAGGSVR